MPFRTPPGLKQVWVNKTTGLRANRGEGDAITEYFKPGEEPDDGSSFLGFEQVALEPGQRARPSDAYGAAPPAVRRQQPQPGLFGGTW